MLRINLPVNPNLPDELPAGIYTGVCGSSNFSSGAALEFNYYDTQYWCSSLMSEQWFGDKCGVKVTREDNGDWSIIMINYNWTYGYVKYVYNETVSQPEPESKEFTLASLDEKTYNPNKYGFEYSFATEDGNVYGSIYINNGMNTSELVEGTYAFHNMYGDVYTPGFTATLRDNGGLQSLASGSMVVTAENVVITLNDYILVYTFESTVTPEPEPEPDPTPDPDQPVEDFTDWVFDAHYDTSNAVVTLSGKNDTRVITLVTNTLAFAKFYATSENHSNYFTNLTVDGVPTDDVTPNSYVYLKSNSVEINLVINGVTYTGTSKSFNY
jgi:hypothetical protein